MCLPGHQAVHCKPGLSRRQWSRCDTLLWRSHSTAAADRQGNEGAHNRVYGRHLEGTISLTAYTSLLRAFLSCIALSHVAILAQL